MGCKNDGALQYIGVKYMQRGYQVDDSFLKELNRSSKRRKKRKLYLLVLTLLFIPIVVFGSYKGVSALISNKEKPKKAILINRPEATGTENQNTAANNSLQPVSSNPTPVNSAPTTSNTSPDRSIVIAGLCVDAVNNAKAINTSNTEYYFGYWKMWNQSFYGRYDSPEALQQKQYYKNLYQGQYRELVNSLNKQFSQLGQCGSGTAEEILIQPNYSAW